jgi:hypothetical protein
LPVARVDQLLQCRERRKNRRWRDGTAMNDGQNLIDRMSCHAAKLTKAEQLMRAMLPR